MEIKGRPEGCVLDSSKGTSFVDCSVNAESHKMQSSQGITSTTQRERAPKTFALSSGSHLRDSGFENRKVSEGALP